MPAEVEGTPKTSFRRTLGQLGRLVPKGRRSRWWILAGFSLIAAVIEAVGGLLIFGVLELVQGGDSTVGEQVESIVQSFLPDASDSQVLTSVLIAAALFFVVRCNFRRVKNASVRL